MSAQVTNLRTISCRKKRGRPRSKSAPAAINIAVRQKRKQWANEAMMAAMDEVRSGELSVSRVAMIVYQAGFYMAINLDLNHTFLLLKKKNLQIF